MRLLFVVVEEGLVVDGLQQVGQHLLRRLAVCPLLDAIDEMAEREQRLELARLHAPGEAFLEGGVEKRHVPLAGIGAERLQGCRTDAPLRRRRGADEGGIVVLVGQQAQVGGDVLDLGLVEERLAAREQVGNLLVAQLRLEQPGLVVRAIEDGVVGELAALLEAVRLELHHHAFRFGLVVPAGSDGDLVTVAEFGPELLVEQLLVVRDDVVGGLQDAHRQPVVLLQRDDLERRKFGRQPLQVADVGPAPAVDRLIVVADGSELGADAGQQLEELVLAGVGILVFVNQQVAQAVLPFLGDRRVLAEEPDRQADQVIEIHRLVGPERRLVGHEGTGGKGLVLIGRPACRAASGVTSAFFQFEITACSRRSVPLSAVRATSPMMPAQSAASKIEKRGL